MILIHGCNEIFARYAPPLQQQSTLATYYAKMPPTRLTLTECFGNERRHSYQIHTYMFRNSLSTSILWWYIGLVCVFFSLHSSRAMCINIFMQYLTYRSVEMMDFINAELLLYASAHLSFGGRILFIIDDTSTNCP